LEGRSEERIGPQGKGEGPAGSVVDRLRRRTKSGRRLSRGPSAATALRIHDTDRLRSSASETDVQAGERG